MQGNVHRAPIQHCRLWGSMTASPSPTRPRALLSAAPSNQLMTKSSRKSAPACLKSYLFPSPKVNAWLTFSRSQNQKFVKARSWRSNSTSTHTRLSVWETLKITNNTKTQAFRKSLRQVWSGRMRTASLTTECQFSAAENSKLQPCPSVPITSMLDWSRTSRWSRD